MGTELSKENYRDKELLSYFDQNPQNVIKIAAHIFKNLDNNNKKLLQDNEILQEKIKILERENEEYKILNKKCIELLPDTICKDDLIK